MHDSTDEVAPANTDTGRMVGLDTGASYFLAGCSAAAAAIHFAMVPAHASSGALEPLGFALAGWFQLAVAGLLLRRSTKAVLLAAALGNFVLIDLWAVSRTVGLPVGAHAGIAEEAGALDLVCVGLQAVVVVLALAALLRPLAVRVPAFASAVGGVAALAVASVVIVSPEAASHGGSTTAAATATLTAGGTTATAAASDGHTGHSHGGSTTPTATASSGAAHAAQMALIESSRCDYAFNPQAYWDEARLLGVDTVAGGTMTMDSGDTVLSSILPTRTSGRGSAELDELVALTSQSTSESASGVLVGALAEVSDETYLAYLEWLRDSGQVGGATHEHATNAAGDGTGHGGHVGPQPWRALVDQSDCDALAAELDRARAASERYPTAADAMADGYVRVAPYVSGIASHWMKFGIVDGTFDIDNPEMLLFDGNDPTSRIVGLSYYVRLEGNFQPTQGFTGENDQYHRHLGLCIGPGGVIGDTTTTDEECAALGGTKASGFDGWMSHAWVVPGCESPWGVFSATNPVLDRSLREASGTNEGGCSASLAAERYDLSPGRAPVATDADVTGLAAGD